MDLQEEKVQEGNLSSGSLEDNTNEENTSSENKPEILCFVNNNSDEKAATISSATTGENNSQNLEVNSENNNPIKFVSELEKDQEDRPQQDEAMVVTEEKGETVPSDDKQPHKPFVFSIDSLKKPCNDDDSIDSSSDSSSTSSSSSDEDEMDDDDDDDDDDTDEVQRPKVLPREKQGEKEKSHENENSTTPHFPIYRNYKDDESSYDSSSDSTSSSSSEMEDAIAVNTERTNGPRKDSDSEERLSRPRVKGEIFPEELPALENLNVSVKDTVDLKILGKITSVIKNIAVVKSEYSCPIDQDSVIFLKDRTCVGKVHDIFGPVREPFYTVHLDKNYTMIPLDTLIYCAPEEKEFTNYVFVNDLKNLKGSDASWEHDIEPPEKFIDFSDDEQERQVKKLNRCKHSANDDSTNEDPNDRNGKSQQKNRLFSIPDSNKKWRKNEQSRGTNSKSFSGTKDASQKSMFAYSNKWPPGNEQCNFSSWPPPTPPPPPPPPHSNDPTFPNYNQLNSMMWPPNYPWTYSSTDMSPFRSPWSVHQNHSNMGLYPGGAPNYPPSGNTFVPPPPSHPWFQGPQRLPHGSQGPLRPHGPYGFMRNHPPPPPPPPRFSQPPQFPGIFP